MTSTVPSPLSLDTLRSASLTRVPLFRNRHGEVAHLRPDGSDWSPASWLQALLGELGEYAEVRIQFEAGELEREAFIRAAAKELADVQCYLSLLASRALDTPAAQELDASPAGLLQQALMHLGTYANARKKFERGDYSESEFSKVSAGAIAQAVSLLQGLSSDTRPAQPATGIADDTGVNLSAATRAKFNEVSRRVGVNVFIVDDNVEVGPSA